MEGHLLMSHKELHRKTVLELVLAKRLRLVEASERMHLSYRQTLRVFARFSRQGDAGLVHRRRGPASNRAYPPHSLASRRNGPKRSGSSTRRG